MLRDSERVRGAVICGRDAEAPLRGTRLLAFLAQEALLLHHFVTISPGVTPKLLSLFHSLLHLSAEISRYRE